MRWMVVLVSMKPQVPDYYSLYSIFHIYIHAGCDIFYIVIQRIISFLLNFIADGSRYLRQGDVCRY